MKKILTMLAAASAVCMISSCQEDPITEETTKEGPSIEWASNPDFDTVDITDDLNATLTVKAPAGIKTFVVTVDSDQLEVALGYIGITSTSLDLINDQTVIEILDGVTQGTLPTGTDLVNQTEVEFNISSLVQMINDITYDDSEHSFMVSVSDNNDRTAEEACTFHRIGVDSPSVTWEGNADFAPMEITQGMSVKITISAPAGFQALTVDIQSAALNNHGITSIDIMNPGTMADIVNTILAGQDITTATELTLDLSELVPMILIFGDEAAGSHTFTLNLTDKAGKMLERDCVFTHTLPASVSVDANSVDLWANTAKVTVANPAADATYSVQYREKGTETWYTASGDATTGFTLAPEYNTSTNAADLSVSVVKDGSGIYAQNTYEIRLMNGETEVSSIEYTTQGGDAIPNGDMSDWTTKDGNLPYPNAEGESFWDSGNNSLAAMFGNYLCQEDSDDGAAFLSANMVLGSVFAPGNMYAGDFTMSGVMGTANFGKSYKWTARPRALSLRYKANVGAIDKIGENHDGGDAWSGKQDTSRVFVAVVDWNVQHGVTSGMGEPTGMWDPADRTSVEEGNILGYGELVLTGNVAAWTDAELKINWYDASASAPDSDKISLVISCATSIRGDYLTGCSNNQLWVDDFEWVY